MMMTLPAVDTLPALRSATAVAEHVRLYFRDAGPGFVRLGSELGVAPPFRPVLSRVVREGVFALAHRFIAGETPAAAVPRLAELAHGGVGYTVDLLGEATLSEVEADVYAGRYRELIETLAAQAPGPSEGVWQGVPRVNVSIKLSALCSQFEAAAPERVGEVVRSRLLPLLHLARERGAFVNVDMEQYRYKDLVHSVFAETQFVSCRNVLIYFNRQLQNRALGLFHESLCHRGFLGLGSKETARFTPHEAHYEELPERLYRKVA